MKSLIEGKRIFDQDGTNFYLVFPEEKIKEYKYLSYTILIKKGDILHPTRWINYSRALDSDVLIPSEQFNFENYEFVFHPEGLMIEELNDVLKEIDFTINADFSNIFEIQEIPSGLLPRLVAVFEEYKYSSNDVLTVEAFSYIQNDELKYIILDSEFTNDDIIDEYTKEFLSMEIIKTYSRQNEDETEFLIKTIGNRSIYAIDELWYAYYPVDPQHTYHVLTNIFEIEDMLPYTNFSLCK